MKINLQPIISPSLPMTALIYIGFVAIWMGFYWLYDFPVAVQGYAQLYANSILPFNSLIANAITICLVILNSMIIAQMNNRFAIIRTRTFMPTFVYLLLSVCWLPAYGNYVATLSAMSTLLAIYLTLSMYKDRVSVEQAFLSFFFVAISTFLVNEFVLLTLVFWIGFMVLNSFSPRIFFASVFGYITPWILFFAVLYFIFGKIEFLPEVREFVMETSVFDYKNIPAFFFAGIMLFILITSLVQITANDRQDSIMTRNILNFFKIFIFALLLIMVFRYSGFASYMPLVAILYALITSYIFTLLQNMFNGIIFIVLCVINFGFAFYLLIF